MSIRVGIWALLAACAVALSGCSGGSRQADVPKPDAWPRVTVYPAAYSRSVDGFAVNDSALIERGDSAGWYTLLYPAYGPGTRIYLTVSAVSPTQLPQAIDNRTERMALNAGGGRSELTELESEGGFACSLLTTRAGTLTPLQFLAYNRWGKMVSGVLFIDGAATAAPDSFAPVVDAIERDIVHSLKHLR